MFEKVLNYKPAEQDYRMWLVVNPGTWLIPILVIVLGVALVVHSVVFDLLKPWSGA
jgi:light-harvesting protein B-800-850 alpha chain